MNEKKTEQELLREVIDLLIVLAGNSKQSTVISKEINGDSSLFIEELNFYDNSQCTVNIAFNLPGESGNNWALLERMIPLLVKDSDITAPALLPMIKILKAIDRGTIDN